MPKFQKGQSGNPAGRKPGSGTLLRKELKAALKGQKAKEFAAKVISMAMAGNVQACRLVLEHVDGKPRSAEEMAKLEAANQPKMSPEQRRAALLEILRQPEMRQLITEAIKPEMGIQ